MAENSEKTVATGVSEPEKKEKPIVLDMAEQRIKQYLDEMSERDESFREKYKSDNQSIRDCRIYIEGEVRKQMRAMFTDDEIFGMAVHFFVEGIQVGHTGNMSKIVHSGDYSKEEIEKEIAKLDEAKKEKLKAVAEREFVEQQKKRIEHNTPDPKPSKPKPEPKPKKEPKTKAKKASEPMMLDLFAGLE